LLSAFPENIELDVIEQVSHFHLFIGAMHQAKDGIFHLPKDSGGLCIELEWHADVQENCHFALLKHDDVINLSLAILVYCVHAKRHVPTLLYSTIAIWLKMKNMCVGGKIKPTIASHYAPCWKQGLFLKN
jgi:hypothetical protein